MSVYISSSQYLESILVTTDESSNDPGPHYDLIAFLAIVQQFKIDILPVMWDAVGAVGKGATATVHQSTVNVGLEFALKRTEQLFKARKAPKAFELLIWEVTVLGAPAIRNHSNIVDLEGICWEIDKEYQELSPVLVFQKARHGDLAAYLTSPAGMRSSFDTKLSLCVDIAHAIDTLHSSSKYSRVK